MDRSRIPRAASARLSLYHRQLELCVGRGEDTVSSERLGAMLGLTAAQVRKDLAYFGQFGHPGIGYKVRPLMAEVRRILGTDRLWDVVLVGAGNLGTALLKYRGFEARGFKIAALFDIDPAVVERPATGLVVKPMEALESVIEAGGSRLAVIAVPAQAAQGVANRLVAAGITGILNFAPVALDTPPHVAVSNVDLAIELEQLAYTVLSRGEPGSGDMAERTR